MGPGQETYVILDSDHPIALYYKVMGRRRLYICLQSAPEIFDIHRFPEIEIPMAVVSSLSGRAYDRYKRSIRLMERMTEGRVFSKRINFFIRFAELCALGKNSIANMRLLLNTEE